MAWVGQNITRRLQNETYEHLNALSIDFFHERDTGNLMSRITHDVSRLRDFIASGIQDIIGDSLTIIFMCAIMFSYNWQLALWTLIPIPCLIFFTIFFGHKMSKVYHVLWKRYASISTILASTIPGVRVVKAFARERYEINRFSDMTHQVFMGEMNAAKLGSLYRPIMEFITYSGSILIWLVGGWQIFQDNITLGTLFMFQSYMMQFFRPVSTLCQMNERFIRAGTSAERVFEIMDTPPSVADKNNAVALRNIRGAVEFRNVYFSYDGEKNALNGVNFTVEPGEMIGLVGHSGAGKSTLINLITRFYDPNDGEIVIDGYDSRDIQVKALRQQIGVVLQDPFLFQGTIAENIGYSKRLTPKFSRAVSELEGLVSQTETNSDGRPRGRRGRGRRGQGPGGMSSEAKGRCEKCGQPIPSWSDVCVNCVQKGKLIFRLMKYAVPLWYVVVPAFLLMMVIRFVGVYPPILGKELVDAILKPVETAVSSGQPLPETTWGHLQGSVNFLSG